MGPFRSLVFTLLSLAQCFYRTSQGIIYPHDKFSKLLYLAFLSKISLSLCTLPLKYIYHSWNFMKKCFPVCRPHFV